MSSKEDNLITLEASASNERPFNKMDEGATLGLKGSFWDNDFKHEAHA